jgi:hypothetical protein
MYTITTQEHLDDETHTLVQAYGPITVLSYIANFAVKALGALPAERSVSVSVLEHTGDGETRSLVEFTGDADTAAVVLKTKVAKVRARAGAPAEDTAGDGAPAEDTAGDETPATTTRRRGRAAQAEPVAAE